MPKGAVSNQYLALSHISHLQRCVPSVDSFHLVHNFLVSTNSSDRIDMAQNYRSPHEDGNTGFASVWDPSSADMYKQTHSQAGFARTVPSFSSAAVTWARTDMNTSTSTSGSWPISSSKEWPCSMSKDVAEESVEWPSGPPINRWTESVPNVAESVPHVAESTSEVMQDEDMMEDDQQQGKLNT